MTVGVVKDGNLVPLLGIEDLELLPDCEGKDDETFDVAVGPVRIPAV